MSIRTRFVTQVMLSSSANEEKNIANVKSELYSDIFGEAATISTVVPISTTDLLITPPTFAAIKFVAIQAVSNDPTLLPTSLSIKFNGTGNDPITLAPMGPTATQLKESWLLLTTSGVTSIHVTNGSTTVPMKVTVYLAAD